MKKILGLRSCIYKVTPADLEKAKQWYTALFETEPYFDQSFYVGFMIGGYELGLQPEDATKGENISVFWGVEDINAEFKRWQECGAEVASEPQDVGESIMVATLRDPWGNILGMISNPHYKHSA